MTTNRTALVLGATGGVGGEVARQLIASGWSVRAMQRDPDELPASAKASDWFGIAAMPFRLPMLLLRPATRQSSCTL